MADSDLTVNRRRVPLWVAAAIVVVIVAIGVTIWSLKVNHSAAPHDDCGVVEPLGPKWNKMQQSVAALESGAGETKDLLAIADAESAMADHIRAAQASVSAPDMKTQLSNWAEGTALTAKAQHDAATAPTSPGWQPPAPGVNNDSMRATSQVYNATTALKKACPHLQVSQAPQT